MTTKTSYQTIYYQIPGNNWCIKSTIPLHKQFYNHFSSLKNKFGFQENHIPFLLNINLQADYGSLSAKAIKKVLPHLMDGHIYDKACTLVGYNHSSSLTTEQNNEQTRPPGSSGWASTNNQSNEWKNLNPTSQPIKT